MSFRLLNASFTQLKLNSHMILGLFTVGARLVTAFGNTIQVFVMMSFGSKLPNPTLF